MKALLAKIRRILRDRRVRQGLTRFVSLTAAIVVFVTTYALVLPAITMESEAACGIQAHQHSDECYEEVLVCGLEESDGHTHDDSCYTVEQVLKCEIEEHQHSAEAGCYDEEGNLICTQTEHQHDENCYEEVRTLTCGLEESEGHHHDSSCYEKQLVCGLEAHTHSSECYKENSSNSSAVAASTGSAAVETGANTEDNSAVIPSQEDSGAAGTTGVLPEEIPSEELSEGYVPTLDELNVDSILTKETGFYYFHAEDGEEIPENSAEIRNWKKAKDKTTLASADLVKAYFSYSIPEGALNETNQVARYRLPANLHLTDDQIIAINQTENGIAASYVNPSNGTVLAEDQESYQKYLGAEAVEGSRKPDEQLNGGAQEYISAIVKAENVFDEEGVYGEKGAYLGQDLIFIFTPYTIEKNQNTYDNDGNPVTKGHKVTGWFACDFNMTQIDWTQAPVDEDLDNTTVEKTAEVVFAAENKGEGISEISRTLRMIEYTDLNAEEAGSENEQADPAGTAGTETAEPAEGSDDNSTEAAAGTTADTSADPDKEEKAENEGTDKDQGPEYKSGTLTAEGEDYKITLDYSADAKIPENAALTVREITVDSDPEAYEACLEQAKAHPSTGDSNVDQEASRFFDIEITAKNEAGDQQKIEPAAPVSVNIQLPEKYVSAFDNKADKDKEDGKNNIAKDSSDTQNTQDPTILHFAEKGVEQVESVTKQIEPTENTGNGSNESATEIQFQAESFSIYGVVYTVDFYREVNGKIYEFSIPGGGFVSLEHVVEVLGIAKIGENTADSGEDEAIEGENVPENSENTAENDVYNGVEETGVEEIDENTGSSYEESISLNNVEVSEATKKFVADVASVEFSSPELVWVGKVDEAATVGVLKEDNGLEVQYSAELTEEQIAAINNSKVEAGDWALISVLPFTSEESLTVTMKNGDQFTVRVTDGQIKKTVIDAKGDTWEIIVTYDDSAEIPDGAELKVEEILPEDEKYGEYYQQSLDKVGVVDTEDDEETAEEPVSAEEVLEETENTTGLVSTIESEEVEQDAAQTSDYARIFDIQIWVADHEIQPKSAVTVNIKLVDAPEESIATPSVVHFAKGGAELMELTERAENSENEGIQFTTDEFSVYSVIYTVDFLFKINGKQFDFSIEGGNAITFREAIEFFEIIEVEEVDTFINNVAKVEFSNPDHIWVGKVDEDIRIGELKKKNHLEVEYSSELKQGNIDAINIRPIKAPDWALVSLKPFTSEEILTVTMKNGEVFSIQVTDAQDDAVLKPDGTVQTIANPAGTTIDLFDYWITDNYRYTAGRDAWPGHYRYPGGPMYSEFYEFDWYDYYGNYQCSWGDGFNSHNENWRNTHLRGNGNNQGINSGHNFKFNPGVGGTVVDGTLNRPAVDGNNGVNSWTTNASPCPGLVIGTLDGGYPKLTNNSSLGTDGSSLSYLFNGSNGTGKEAYTGVNQLLYVDKDGYYTFNSNDFDAQFNSSSGSFTVSPQSNPTGEARGFWPFGNQVYWHGMHINTQFSMPVEGKVLSPNGNYNDMIFEFQGDDDTWVYVDGVLVGDGGGIHNQTRIVVNFREGTVLVSGEYDVRSDYRTDYHEVKYLDDLYRAAGVYDQYTWVDSPTVPGHRTFAPNSYHTFDMFYLERGGGESNLYIHYNMIATYDFTAHKSYHNSTNDRLYRDEFKFELIGLDGQYKNGTLTDANKAAIMPKGGTEGGSGNVGDAQKMHYPASGGSPGYTYYKVGVSEDGNVNFGAADFSSQEMADCDAGNPSTYRYIIREVVPDDAVNEFGVAWKDATDEEKEEGGFKLDGITYDDKVYYMTATVTRWQNNGRWEYGLSKRYYTDDTYTTEASDNFASFVNGFVQPLTLEVLKMSDKGSKLLEGAEFTLVRAMHTDDQKWVPRHYVKDDEVKYAPVRTATTSNQGTLSFDNLTEGHYILEETAAPEGYETGEISKWLITLTKQDADDEIKLIPTFTPLNADGSVAGAASDPVNVDSTHTFRYQVLNGKPPVNISVEKQWFDNGDSEPPADASATFALHRVRNVSPVRVELLDSQGVKICDVSAYVGDTVKIYDSGTNDFQHHTPTPGGLAVLFGDNSRDRRDVVAPNDSGWTISTINVYTISGWNVILDSYTSTSNGQYTVKESDVSNGVVQLHLSENYLASETYGFDKNPVLYVSNNAGGSSTTDEVIETFTLKAEGGDGDAGNPWKKTFSNLPGLDDQGNEYHYYIVETGHTPANYDHQAITGNMGNAGSPLSGSEDIIVTNSTAELPRITASKIWKDEDGNVIDATSGSDGLEVRLTLYKGSEPALAEDVKNGSVTQTVTGNGTTTWFLLDEHGDVTQYSVRETAVRIPGGDFIDVTTDNPFGGTVAGDSINGYLVTNQLPTTGISVTKRWKDGTSANVDKIFDEVKTISFTLYQKLGGNAGTVCMRDDQAVTGTVTYTPASEGTAASWSTEQISNLPKYVFSDGTWYEAAYYPTEMEIDGVRITYQSGNDNAGETPSDAAVSSGTIMIINTDIVVPINIIKVDETNTETKLGGATFKLTKVQAIDSTNQVTEGKYEKTGTTSSEDATKGQLTFEGLTPGYYYLEETESPAGYIKTEAGWHFQVDADGIVRNVGDANDTGKFQFVNASDITILNTPGAALPSTGGPGAKLIYLLGIMLAGLAGVGFVMKWRRKVVL